MYLKSKVILPICIGILPLLSACNIDMGSRGSSFSVPVLSGNKWESTGYPFKDGDTAYCVVDGGRNNLRIIMELAKGETEVQNFVESTRRMPPGVTLTVNSSDNNFRTSTKSLSATHSNEIVKDLLDSQNLYLRWSEPHGGSGGRRNFTNIITSDNFIPPYKKCQEFINNLLRK